jgi:hypothetical protein
MLHFTFLTFVSKTILNFLKCLRKQIIYCLLNISITLSQSYTSLTTSLQSVIKITKKVTDNNFLNTVFSGHYSSSSSASSFTSSVPSTPIFAPKRQNSADENESDAKSEIDEPKSGEVLSVKTLANMFDFKSVSHVPTFKPSAAKLEDSKIFQRAARLCEETSQIGGEQINLLKPLESEVPENKLIPQED